MCSNTEMEIIEFSNDGEEDEPMTCCVIEYMDDEDDYNVCIKETRKRRADPLTLNDEEENVCTVNKRKFVMAANPTNFQKESEAVENRDIWLCCGESYDTCYSGFVICKQCSKKFKSETSLGHFNSEKFLHLHQQHLSRGRVCGFRRVGT